MNAMWYALVQDEQLGPMDFDEVIDFYYKDIISSETLLWREGLSGWLPISQIYEFKKLLFQGEFLSPSEPSSGVSGVSDTRVFTEELGSEMRALASAPRPSLPAAPALPAARALPAAPALRPPPGLPAAPALRPPPGLPALPSAPALQHPAPLSARETNELKARQEEPAEDLLSVDIDLEPEGLNISPEGLPHLGGAPLGPPRPIDLSHTPPPAIAGRSPWGDDVADPLPSVGAPLPGLTPSPSSSSPTPAPRPLELRPAAPPRKSPLPWVALSLVGALGAAYGLGVFGDGAGVKTLDPPTAPPASPAPEPEPALEPEPAPQLDALPAPQGGALAAPLPLPDAPLEVELPSPTGGAPVAGAAPETPAGSALGEGAQGGSAQGGAETIDFEIEVEELAVTEAPQGGGAAAPAAEPAPAARKKPGAPSPNRRYKPKPTQKRRASKRSPKPPAAEPEKPPAAAPAGTCCTRDQVNRVVNASLGKIKACAEADAALKGSTVVVSITIMPSGKVENARATSSALRQSPQGGCVVQVVQGLKFPTFAGEPLPIQLPLKL